MKKIPFIYREKLSNIHFDRQSEKPSEIIFFAYFFTVVIIFVVIFFRLFQLTIVKGDYYRTLSEQNRIKEIPIEAPRGQILDRKGFVLAKSELPDTSKLKDINSKRVYSNPEVIAPLIGYRQQADTNDLLSDNCIYKLKLGDRIGKKGIESVYDCALRGVPGKKLIEIDAKGNYLKTIDIISPTTGQTVQLAMDLDLQKKAYELLAGKEGAIVINNPKTGAILGFVSSPSYNPQDFEDLNQGMIGKYLTDPKKPLFNRITEGVYPPGSLFKLAIATAALQEGAIDEKTQFEDTGQITAGTLKFGNWYYLQYGKTEGLVDIVKAIKRSNDTFFYQAGAKTGVEKIKKWAEILGFGKKTGIAMDEEVGVIPGPFWKQEMIHDQWYLGDTYNLSIGQGYMTVTPLQTLLATSVFANGGYLCQPQLLKNDVSNCKKLPISQKTIDLIKEGMREACATGGTGWPLFEFKASGKAIQTACKTGTAESESKSGLPHAWITVFAPYENPEIALTVLVETAGQGSDVAGPIAKELLKTYFERSQ